jgi:hypothetical protein
MSSTSNALLIAMGILLGAVATPAMAQAPQATSVTGCLSKGATKDAFTIEGTDGKSYSLTSATVQLGQHVGHKVTVTGTPSAMETGALKDTSMAKDTSMKKKAAAGGNALNVSDLKMVSTQCK